MTSKRHLPLVVEQSVTQAHADRLLLSSEVHAKALAGGTLTCKQGCASCCYYPINVSILEGVYIYQWLQENRMWTQPLRNRVLEHKLATLNLAPEIWLVAMIPCPFLGPAKECRIYEARPFLCRTVYTHGDSYDCHPHRLGLGMTTILDRKETVDALWKAEARVLKRHKLNEVTFSLSAAVLLGERIYEGELQLEDAYEALAEDLAHV